MMVRTRVLAAVGAAVAVGVVAFASTAASQNAGPAADDPNDANLTYWYWGEDDAPGANGWLKQQVALYEKAHPKVKITVVTQSTDTLTSAFTTAAQTKSGPDIATQWATLPVLTPAWNGASVPISDFVPAGETKIVRPALSLKKARQLTKALRGRRGLKVNVQISAVAASGEPTTITKRLQATR